MMQLAARAGVALGTLALVTTAGCLFDPNPKQLGPGATATEDGTTGATQAAPLNPLDYTSEPVPTGLLADMLMMGGELYEPADNWWNTKVKNAPVDPNSDAIIQLIKSYDSTRGRLHPDFAADSGIPYCVVDNETPLVPVTFADPGESDAGLPGGPAGYPIPADAITDLRYIENAGRDDGDRHLLVFQKDKRVAFELVRASYANGQWSAGYGAVFKLDSNYRRPDGWTSTDAAGLCVLAGLLRYDEVWGPWPIRHALRVSIRRTNDHVYPASHTGARDAGAPPLGMRLRLKKDTDISGYPMHIRKIFTAMKTYGLIVADRGGNMYVQGTMDSRWNNAELNPIFYDFTIDDFEVIELGWKPGAQ
ncbi:MAG TPA: hypothetical protein VF247_12660 [Candidatus Krumholzibacteria bacterium]